MTTTNTELQNETINTSNTSTSLQDLIQRVKLLELRISQIAHSVSYEKESPSPTLRVPPDNESFLFLLDDKEVKLSKEEINNIIGELAADCIDRGIPVMDERYFTYFTKFPAINAVIRSNGEYTVLLRGMVLSPIYSDQYRELLCIFETETHDLFYTKFRKNHEFDIFTPSKHSLFDIKQVQNLLQLFTIDVSINKKSSLLYIKDMIPYKGEIL